jgi:cytochrome c-type biogenesis protein CcmH
VSNAPGITVKVELAPELSDKVQPGDAVFIFARAVSGPPMPLAVKRLTVADLPAEVSLSDNDAMMPQLKISGFEQVQLVARISRSGNATAGEWIGSSQPIASKTTDLQQLRIDTADTPTP